MNWLRGIISSAARSIIVAIAAVAMVGGVYAIADYAVTLGVGTNFGSKIISSVHYAQMLISDPTTPAQIAKVDANGNLNVIAGSTAGQTASSTTGSLVQCNGLSAAQTAVTTGQTQNVVCELGGQLIVRQGAVEGLRARGGGNSSNTGAITLLAASGSASLKEYLTDIECGNSNASTSVIVTLNDGASTVLLVPANGGNNKTFSTPLVVAANTALTATPGGSGAAIVYCFAQGYYAP